MGIENLHRWQWALIGTIGGLLLAFPWTIAAPKRDPVMRQPLTSEEFVELLARVKSQRRRMRDMPSSRRKGGKISSPVRTWGRCVASVRVVCGCALSDREWRERGERAGVHGRAGIAGGGSLSLSVVEAAVGCADRGRGDRSGSAWRALVGGAGAAGWGGAGADARDRREFD